MVFYFKKAEICASYLFFWAISEKQAFSSSAVSFKIFFQSHAWLADTHTKDSQSETNEVILEIEMSFWQI